MTPPFSRLLQHAGGHVGPILLPRTHRGIIGQGHYSKVKGQIKVTPMSLPSINFLHLTVSEIEAGQTFPPPIRTPWVKIIPRQPLKNARRGHLVFQNEANFSTREAYPPMKISCKFGEHSWCSFPLRALTPEISLGVAA